MRGFLLDLNRCTGCHACLLACNIENELAPHGSWRRLYTVNPRSRPGASRFHLSIGCLHCSDPACMQCCPAAAYSRDQATGAVLVDAEKCIGCHYCSWACPFDAPHYDHAAGTMSKCTFCNSRLHDGRNPACASLCPTGALQIAEIDPRERLAPVSGFPDTRIGPALHIVPLRSAATGPELTAYGPELPAPPAVELLNPVVPSKITIESEWSLIFFSVAAALLVAVAADAASGSMRLQGWDFLIASLGTMAVSALHLGKRQRSWRAVLNLRTSWLSREIAAYGAFTVLTTVMFLFPAIAPMVTWPAVLCGFGALFCIDQVYESISSDKWIRLHSARVLLTGLLMFGILSMDGMVAGLAGLIKLVLYAYRQSWFQSKPRAFASALRLALGFVVPLAIWRVYPDWILPSVLIAEVIDRCEYYLDLDVTGMMTGTEPRA
jgi:Fe-S-cluster-containing dehydrogenase component/DMSO reductase anchor subunit